MNKLAKILEEEGLKKKASRPPGLEEALKSGDPKAVARYYADKNDIEFARYFSHWAGESYGDWVEKYNAGTFFRDIELEAQKLYRAQQDEVFNKLSPTEKKVALLLGAMLTFDRLLPKDIKDPEGRLVYQVRNSKGQPSNINLMHPFIAGNVSRREWEKKGLTAFDIIEYLDKYGAKRRGRAPKRPRDRGPIYD